MKRFISRSVAALTICALGIMTMATMTGCVEDEIDIKVNADGSGTVTHKITLSKKLTMQLAQMEKMKAQQQGNVNVNIQMEQPFPTSKEEIKKMVGDSFKITSQSIVNAGGKRTIQFTGKFDNAQKFFSSEYVKEKVGLHWKKKAGKTQLHIGTPEKEGQPEISLQQMYAFAKGLYVKRAITLPNALSGAKYGQIDQKNRRVTWEVDLRNEAGLKKATPFFEGPQKGNDKVAVKGKLKFKVPLTE